MNPFWVKFVSHVLIAPILVNRMAVLRYISASIPVYVLAIFIFMHCLLAILPATIVLLWVFSEPIFHKTHKILIALFCSLLAFSCVFGSIYGLFFFVVLLSLVQLLFVTSTVPIVAVGLRKREADTSTVLPTRHILAPVLPDIVVRSEQSINEVEEIKHAAETCPICLEELGLDHVQTICHHRFHLDCILAWAGVRQFKPTCPLCNHILTQNKHNNDADKDDEQLLINSIYS
eukprot:NODE_265_length_12372_cov_0.450012.p7 type:complete len:232 gc:universal NODE_265_length_12372_cov_0.450012:12080-11385(-)